LTNSKNSTVSCGDFSLDCSLNVLEGNYFKRELYTRYRPTVKSIVIHEGRVLLVQSAKDDTGATWIPPQGGVGHNETVFQAIRRELREELGDDLFIGCEQPVLLGHYVNTVRDDHKPKLILAVAVTLCGKAKIKLNNENKRYHFTRNQHDLWNIMHRTRRVKLLGTCCAINKAHNQGLLSWSCDDIINFYPDSDIAAA